MEILKDIAQNLIAGDDEKVAELVALAIQTDAATVRPGDDRRGFAAQAAAGR